MLQWSLAALPLLVFAAGRLVKPPAKPRVVRMARPRPPSRPPPRRTTHVVEPAPTPRVPEEGVRPPRVRVTDLQEVSWRKWRHVLGGVYWAWATFQVLAAIWLAGRELADPLLYWGSTAVIFALYLWAGARLMQDRYDGRLVPGLLAALALIEFPIGTAVGVFGLWVVLRRRHARVRIDPVSDVRIEHAPARG